MKRNGTVALALVASLAVVSGSSAGVLSVTQYQDVGATLDLDPGKTYTHKLDFPSDGQSLAINGVQLSAVGYGSGTDPLTGNPYSLTIPSAQNWGSGSDQVLWDFCYAGSQPVGATEVLTLGGLVPGATYDVRLYYRNFGSRVNNVVIDTDGKAGAEWAGALDQMPASASDRNYWSIAFQADSPTVTISFEQTVFNASWHQYAVTNELIAPSPINPFLTLFNTGVVTDDEYGRNATLLANGVADPHWALVSGPQAPPTAPQAEVMANHPAWTANGPDSKWIGVTASGSDNVADGLYTYRTTFTIPLNMDPSTVVIEGYWFADNATADSKIFLNGVDTLIDGSGATYNVALPGTPFTLLDGMNGAHFQFGLNTLDFQVRNAGPGFNPHGLRVNDLWGWGLPLVPEPSTLALLGLGVLGLLRRPYSALRRPRTSRTRVKASTATTRTTTGIV